MDESGAVSGHTLLFTDLRHPLKLGSTVTGTDFRKQTNNYFFHILLLSFDPILCHITVILKNI